LEGRWAVDWGLGVVARRAVLVAGDHVRDDCD